MSLYNDELDGGIGVARQSRADEAIPSGPDVEVMQNVPDLGQNGSWDLFM